MLIVLIYKYLYWLYVNMKFSHIGLIYINNGCTALSISVSQKQRLTFQACLQASVGWHFHLYPQSVHGGLQENCTPGVLRIRGDAAESLAPCQAHGKPCRSGRSYQQCHQKVALGKSTTHTKSKGSSLTHTHLQSNSSHPSHFLSV